MVRGQRRFLLSVARRPSAGVTAIGGFVANGQRRVAVQYIDRAADMGAMNMYCDQCGQQLGPSAKFCSGCGSAVSHGERSGNSEGPSPAAATKPCCRWCGSTSILDNICLSCSRAPFKTVTLPSPSANAGGLRCPTCQAGADCIVRQGMGKRAAKVAAFGVFAAVSAAKTFKCYACGYTW